jgi:hypothetical protein
MHKLILALIGIWIIELWTFISITGYLLTFYIINYTDIEQKYPKLQKIINYYKKTNLYFIIFEVVFFIIFNLALIFLFIHLLYLSME